MQADIDARQWRQPVVAVQAYQVRRYAGAGAQGNAKGTTAEYRAAVMGSSTHYGTIRIDSKRHRLIFHIDGASFPNWEGQQQIRSFEVHGDVLSYRVPPRPNGDVPISVWRRIGH